MKTEAAELEEVSKDRWEKNVLKEKSAKNK